MYFDFKLKANILYTIKKQLTYMKDNDFKFKIDDM